MEFSSSKERCETLGEYIINTGATVRETAKKFLVSKSTVHKDVTEKLYEENRLLYIQVKTVLEKNKSERHLRGGEATKQKYLNAQKTWLCRINSIKYLRREFDCQLYKMQILYNWEKRKGG